MVLNIYLSFYQPAFRDRDSACIWEIINGGITCAVLSDILGKNQAVPVLLDGLRKVETIGAMTPPGLRLTEEASAVYFVNGGTPKSKQR